MTTPAGLPVVVVGAGISGAACAREVVAAGDPVRVLDRGRAPAGRMASPTLHGRPVDTGARYLTARDDAFVAVVSDWHRRGLAQPWTATFHTAAPGGIDGVKAGPTRWSAPAGLRSLVADLLQGTRVEQDREVSVVSRDRAGQPTVDGEPAAAVVLAMPDPQAARVLDAQQLAGVRAHVEGRTWTPQLALVAGWERRSWADDLDGAFVAGSEAVEWVADDGRRRGDGAPVLVAHSTPAFAADRLDTPEQAAGDLVAAVRDVLGVPAAPVWTEVRRWSFASPAEPRTDDLYFLGEALPGQATVGLCGDGWGGSPRVEQAFLSGRALGRAVAQRLGG